MGSWNYSHVGLMFDKSKNDAKLIDQAMKCMGYKETDYLYLDETGLDGPVWSNDCGDMSLNYEIPNDSYVEQILGILNTLFCDISVYSVTANGNTISDYYFGCEKSFDLVTKKFTKKEIDYCFGNSTAFGKKVSSSDFEKIQKRGTRFTENTIENDTLFGSITPELVKMLIKNGTKKNIMSLLI